MTSEEIRNLQINGGDVLFYDGYVPVQEGIVPVNQLHDVNNETKTGKAYA